MQRSRTGNVASAMKSGRSSPACRRKQTANTRISKGASATWLRTNWARPQHSKVYHRINLSVPGAGSDWIHNFRIPDLVLLTQARYSIDFRTHFEGGPEVVVEIRSPNDESEDKLPFYAQIGVLEVWIIDRDTKRRSICTS